MRLVSTLALTLALPVAVVRPGADDARASRWPDAIQRAQLAQPSVVSAQGAVGRAGAQYRTSWGAFIPTPLVQFELRHQLLQRPFARQPDHRRGHFRRVVRPEHQQRPQRLGRPLHGISSRRPDGRGAGHRDRRPTPASSMPSTRRRSAPSRPSSARWRPANWCASAQASLRRAEEQLSVSVAKLQAGSATRSDSLRSLVTLGNAQLAAADRPDRGGHHRGQPGPPGRDGRPGPRASRFLLPAWSSRSATRRRSAPRPRTTRPRCAPRRPRPTPPAQASRPARPPGGRSSTSRAATTTTETTARTTGSSTAAR